MSVAIPSAGAAAWHPELTPDGLPVMNNTPGFLVRRAHQLHVSMWHRHIGRELTSIQYGVLLVVGQRTAVDQTAVAQLMSLDKNTVTDVLRRLRSRGLVMRTRDSADARRMVTRISDACAAMLEATTPAVCAVQRHLLAKQEARQRASTLYLLRMVVGLLPADDSDTQWWVPSAQQQPVNWKAVHIGDTPGHLIRRIQQLHSTLWSEELQADLTSPQYTVLLVLHRDAPMSQSLLGERACLDKATCADVVSRLPNRGYVRREFDLNDNRRYDVTLAPAGRDALNRQTSRVCAVQRRLMGPLSRQNSGLFVRTMAEIVDTATERGR
jgi:DNA-binding MarR family transcriptional regulator